MYLEPYNCTVVPITQRSILKNCSGLTSCEGKTCQCQKLYTTLMEMYNDLKARWNVIWQELEITDASLEMSDESEFCAIQPEFIVKPLFLILRNFAAEF